MYALQPLFTFCQRVVRHAVASHYADLMRALHDGSYSIVDREHHTAWFEAGRRGDLQIQFTWFNDVLLASVSFVEAGR